VGGDRDSLLAQERQQLDAAALDDGLGVQGDARPPAAGPATT